MAPRSGQYRGCGCRYIPPLGGANEWGADTERAEQPAPQIPLAADDETVSEAERKLALAPAVADVEVEEEDDEADETAVTEVADKPQTQDPLKLYVRQIGDGGS